MAPSHSRHLLIWTVPTTVAVLLGYFWYRRKRLDSKKTDPGEAAPKTVPSSVEKTPTKAAASPATNSRTPTFSRSLSGVDSAPIDIVIPPKLKAAKSNPIVISDEDLDLEIEKIKSMRYGGSIDMRKSNICGDGAGMFAGEKTPSPVKKAASPTPSSPPPVVPETVEEEKVPAEVEPEEDGLGENLQVSGSETLALRPNNERDSANHSPADVMLASPSLSSISDIHSEGSNDSGKGGSEVVTPPPSRSIVSVHSAKATITVYEFMIPQQLVGKLIGKHGSSVTNIRDKTGAHVVVRRHPTNNKLKVCAIEGTQKEIASALKLIRDKFPVKRFPEVTLEQVTFVSQVGTVVPDHLQLKLVPLVNNDTILSCLIAPDHLFLQQPTHPTFPNLHLLNGCMNACYNQTESPMLPTPIPGNTICAAFTEDGWVRAMILSSDESTGTCYVKFLDYGGYFYIESSKLRQIRGDFMSLPFQAAECMLANVKPVSEDGWCAEAYVAAAEMTKGAMMLTQVVDYTEERIPLVYCYLIVGSNEVVFLNRELVNLGFATWVEYESEPAAAEAAATGVTSV